jgi:hypothetical protein
MGLARDRLWSRIICGFGCHFWWRLLC